MSPDAQDAQFTGMSPMLQLENIDYRARIAWHKYLPFDECGRPTSEAAFLLVRFFFEHSNRSFAIGDAARQLQMHYDLVQILSAQMHAYAILTQDPPSSGMFRYFLKSPNVDFQARVEASLISYWDWSKSLKLPPFPPLE